MTRAIQIIHRFYNCIAWRNSLRIDAILDWQIASKKYFDGCISRIYDSFVEESDTLREITRIYMEKMRTDIIKIYKIVIAVLTKNSKRYIYCYR